MLNYDGMEVRFFSVRDFLGKKVIFNEIGAYFIKINEKFHFKYFSVFIQISSVKQHVKQDERI